MVALVLNRISCDLKLHIIRIIVGFELNNF
jgi:hypothetical protein